VFVHAFEDHRGSSSWIAAAVKKSHTLLDVNPLLWWYKPAFSVAFPSNDFLELHHAESAWPVLCQHTSGEEQVALRGLE
jgi:hypothetical protein